MVQRRIPVTLCDRCGSTDEVERRRLAIVEKNRQFSFDACAECRRTVPLAEWESLMPRNPRSSIGQMVVPEAVVKQATRGRKSRRVVKSR
jgi:hypothetical protein